MRVLIWNIRLPAVRGLPRILNRIKERMDICLAAHQDRIGITAFPRPIVWTRHSLIPRAYAELHTASDYGKQPTVNQIRGGASSGSKRITGIWTSDSIRASEKNDVKKMIE